MTLLENTKNQSSLNTTLKPPEEESENKIQLELPDLDKPSSDKELKLEPLKPDMLLNKEFPDLLPNL